MLDGRSERPARFDVPEPHGLVGRPGQECAAIGIHGHSFDRERLERPWLADRRTTVEVPPSDPAELIALENNPVVRAHGGVGDSGPPAMSRPRFSPVLVSQSRRVLRSTLLV